MINKLVYGAGCFTLLFILTGCKQVLFHNRISEGSIEYKIEVLDSNNSMANLAPDKMTVKFKNNISFAQVIAGMGLFETDFINDEPGKKIIQMVRLFNKKYAYIADTAAINKELKKEPEYQITPTTETKKIAGYLCKKAMVKVGEGDGLSFPIYYTDKIQLENPNWSTPFKGIDGVLMGYRIKRYGMYLEFTAVKVDPATNDDNTFKLPPDYKLISKEQLDQLIKGFQ